MADEPIVEEAKPKDMEECADGDEDCKKKHMMAEKKSRIDVAVETLRSRIAEAKSAGKIGDAALADMQPIFNELGEAVKEEFAPPPPDPQMAGIADVLRGVLQQEISPVLATLEARVSAMEQKSAMQQGARDVPLVPRSVSIKPQYPATPPSMSTGLKIADIANRSVG